jgi:RNA polymerase sigma-70 factor (ECF subfamily)
VDQTARITVPDKIGESPDLRRIYDEHAPHIERLVQRMLGPSGDADDVVQDVFVIAWKKCAQVPAVAMRRYLSAIAIRVVCDQRRRASVRRFFGRQLKPQLVEWQTPERELEQAEATQLVYESLENVSEKRRTVFILYELHGLTGNEIAELLRCPLKTVWTRLFYARRHVLPRLQALAASRGWEGRR